MPTLTAAGIRLVRAADMGGTIVCKPPSTGNIWIDPSCMPYSLPVSIAYPASAAPNRIVAIDGGPAATILGSARGLTLRRGETVTIRRAAKRLFRVLSPASPQPRTAAFTARSKRILIIGQSLGQQWEYMPAGGAFVDRMKALGATHTWRFLHACTGGSAALPEYKPDATRWWYDPTPGALVAGPMFAGVSALIDQIPAAERPNILLWIQGERDSGTYPGTTAGEDAAFQARYRDSVFRVLDLLRAKLNPADRYAIPAYVQILGRRLQGELRGMPLVRAAQAELIAMPGVNIRIGATQPPDLPLADDVHPTAAGYSILGSLTADAMLAGGL